MGLGRGQAHRRLGMASSGRLASVAPREGPAGLGGVGTVGPGFKKGGPPRSPDRSHVAVLQGGVPEAQVEREARRRRPSNLLSLWLTLVCFLRASREALAALWGSPASMILTSLASTCSAAEP